jgi:hypothetical protein
MSAISAPQLTQFRVLLPVRSLTPFLFPQLSLGLAHIASTNPYSSLLLAPAFSRQGCAQAIGDLRSVSKRGLAHEL